MSARLAAAFTTCQMAFGVIPSPQILSSRLTRRKIAPPLMPAAVIHSSTARFAQSGTGTVRMWAQKAGIGGFISEAPDGGQSHIDRGGREVLLFEKEPVLEDDRPVKCQTWFGTVPPDKFVDGVTV